MAKFTNTFGFTIKDSKTKENMLSEETYQPILNEWGKKGEILFVVYENKSKKGDAARLHVHGSIKFHNRPFLMSFLKPDFIIKFEQIYDMQGWHKYCMKNERKEIENKINLVKYGNIDNKIWMFDD